MCVCVCEREREREQEKERREKERKREREKKERDILVQKYSGALPPSLPCRPRHLSKFIIAPLFDRKFSIEAFKNNE